MTCSIVAADPRTGQSGFAIASCCFDAGQVCIAVPGRGAIASQAQGNMAFLAQFVAAQTEGASLEATLERFRAMDRDIETRQVGMASLVGGSLAFTGNQCSYWAGHRVGDIYSCQGNILVGPQVIEAMATTFENTQGPLFDRLYQALLAADEAGGDARGRQSARVAVYREGSGAGGQGTIIDLRIEDHDDPIAELRRLREQRQTLLQMVEYMESLNTAGDAERTAILAEWRGFLEDKRQPRYVDWWESLAEGYLTAGLRAEALAAYRVYLAISPGLARVIAENAKAGRFPIGVATELGVL